MDDVGKTLDQFDVFHEIGLTNWHFAKTIREIMSKITGLEILEEKHTDSCQHEINKQISGVVVLTGDKSIMISISMAYKTATLLVAYMSDLKHAEIKLEEQTDGVMEITNMIAGQIKAKLSSVGLHYKYLQPFVIVGDNHHILQKNKTRKVDMKFHAGIVDMVLTISIQ